VIACACTVQYGCVMFLYCLIYQKFTLQNFQYVYRLLELVFV
jgi:hypothetical protein